MTWCGGAMEPEMINQQKRITQGGRTAFFRLLPGYIFRILLLLPLVLALIPAFLVGWPLWVREYLHRKKDCIR